MKAKTTNLFKYIKSDIIEDINTLDRRVILTMINITVNGDPIETVPIKSVYNINIYSIETVESEIYLWYGNLFMDEHLIYKCSINRDTKANLGKYFSYKKGYEIKSPIRIKGLYSLESYMLSFYYIIDNMKSCKNK
jgi:hypothetical protein